MRKERDNHRDEAVRGVNRLEGYLLLRAEDRNAAREAEEFARLMPWLTTAQHEEVVRLYTERRIALSRTVIQAVAGRCGELRQEYTTRYEELRRRLVCRTVALMLGMFATCVLVTLWALRV